MDENCYGRRLSELLQEQQEPFLLRRASVAGRLLAFCHRRAVSNKGRALGGLGTSTLFCGSAVRRKLLAGCFSCGARQSFRRLRHAGAGGIAADRDVDDDDDEECARQLSPVSVLDVGMHSDKESSPVLGVGNREGDESPSTSGKSSPPPPPPEQNSLDAAASPCFTFYEAGKNCKTETGEEEYETTKRREGGDGDEQGKGRENRRNREEGIGTRRTPPPSPNSPLLLRRRRRSLSPRQSGEV